MSESNQMGQSNGARDSDMSSMIELIQELWYLKRDLVRRIGEQAGAAGVRDIRFIVPRGGSLR